MLDRLSNSPICNKQTAAPYIYIFLLIQNQNKNVNGCELMVSIVRVSVLFFFSFGCASFFSCLVEFDIAISTMWNGIRFEGITNRFWCCSMLLLVRRMFRCRFRTNKKTNKEHVVRIQFDMIIRNHTLLFTLRHIGFMWAFYCGWILSDLPSTHTHIHRIKETRIIWEILNNNKYE